MTDTQETRVMTPEAMISYPHLFEKWAMKGSNNDPQYSCTLVFAPGTDISKLKAAVLVAGREKWPDGAFEEGLKDSSIRKPFREDAAKKGYAEGSVFINCRAGSKPGVVDQNINEILDKDSVYPGAIVRATVNAFAYDKAGNRGVSFGLGNVQLLRSDTPRLDNRVSPADEFEKADMPATEMSSDPIDDLL